MRFGCSYSNWGFWQWCWQMCRWTMVSPLHMCSGFPTEKVEQMIMMSLDDVTVITHATGGGKHIRTARSSFRGWCLGIWHWMVRSIVKSPTLYFSYIVVCHGAGVYLGWTVYLVYSCACTQTFWEHFSQGNFSCLTFSQVGHYLYPLEPSIKQGMDHNLSQQIA